jgi:D-threo-aldose 1-dehydrogenase
METVALGKTEKRTTRLGFGCSSLMGSMNRRESLATLEAAFDAGIRHFDVAPSYGYGEAESCLGEFLHQHPGQATVTTKYGIASPARQSLVGLARGLVKPLVRMLPGAKRTLAQAAAKVTRSAERPQFVKAPAGESLNRSLTALKTDHIDLWLLHEVQANDLDGEGGGSLIEFLDSMVVSGKIGGFGIASGGEKVPALVAEHPAFCAIRQYEWSVLDPLPSDDGSFRLHHRALTDNFRAIHSALLANPQRADHWSEQVGIDLRPREKLAELMLAAAMVLNPASVILFSSKDATHILNNARLGHGLSSDTEMQTAAARLYSVVQEDGARLFGLNRSSSNHVRVEV